MKKIRIGTAHWNVPPEARDSFPEQGSHLERYGQGLSAVEINSSFYRHHMAATYRRWGTCTPPDFRFSVKLARAFTHDARLVPSGDSLLDSLLAIGELGPKWGCLLVQLPPSLPFEEGRAENFLGFIKEHCPVPVVWEPRHPTWVQPAALALLSRHAVGKVLADPEPCPLPGGTPPPAAKLRYYRLHGTPVIYRSRYRPPFLAKLAREIAAAPEPETWCVFDNTTFGFATLNALELTALLDGLRRERRVS